MEPQPPADDPLAMGRRVGQAELLSIGSELTFGETNDTNAAELARSLTDLGVRVGRITALPDDLAAVVQGFRDGLTRADVVVSTGGLGPTPDDLTREAIASVCGETPEVDAELEEWLRGLWSRRGLPFLDINLKQAWLIPSATAIPNRNGTAPGWLVERADGRLIVALPGPPREMRPMWRQWVLPRLRERGLGRDHVSRTYRTFGIGESQVAELLGEDVLRRPNPLVATYARADGVDVRISAVAEDPRDGVAGRSPDELVRETEALVEAAVGAAVWGRDDETWAVVIERVLRQLGWRLAIAEAGSAGTLASLLAELPMLARAEVLPAADATDTSHEPSTVAERLRTTTGVDVALAIRVTERGEDTGVQVAVAMPTGTHLERRIAFMGGQPGRLRAAVTAAAILFGLLTERAANLATDQQANLEPGQGTPAEVTR